MNYNSMGRWLYMYGWIYYTTVTGNSYHIVTKYNAKQGYKHIHLLSMNECWFYKLYKVQEIIYHVMSLGLVVP